MFERILSLFQPEPNATTLPQADEQHAMGALLVRAAKADKVYLFEEIEQIDDLLAHRYNLTSEQAANLRAECELLDTTMPNTEEFAGVLRDAISHEERVSTILALWEVVFADGRKVKAEDDLLRQLEKHLGVSPEKSKELHDIVASAYE